MFRLVKILNGRTNAAEAEKHEVTADESFKFGEALVLSSGKLTKCAATAKPQFIAGEDYTAPASGARKISAYRVTGDMIFEAPVGADPAALKTGDAVTLSADALGVTATTASGVAKIYSLCGAAAANDKLQICF